MYSSKNILLSGADNKPITLDIFFNNDCSSRPVVIYAHGFNGFKDWGNFDLIAKKIAAQGYVFVKFNFSHNGTTPEHPDEFTDLEAFGNNNYSKELEDLQIVMDWVCDPLNRYHNTMDTNNIFLIGHSMGGGIAILQGAKDKRVKKLITWASISESTTPWGTWPPEKIQEWAATGVQYYINSRTNQQMPLYHQLYEDHLQNRDNLDIKAAIRKLEIPILVCHGTLDTAVPVEKAYELQDLNPSAKLFTIESDHVFGRKHPWESNELPAAMEAVVEETLQFLDNK